VEARGDFPLTCPEENEAISKKMQDMRKALLLLPLTEVETRDVLTRVLYVGKQTLKNLVDFSQHDA